MARTVRVKQRQGCWVLEMSPCSAGTSLTAPYWLCSRTSRNSPLPQHTPWGRAEHPAAKQQQVTAGCSEPTRTSGQLQPCYR